MRIKSRAPALLLFALLVLSGCSGRDRAALADRLGALAPEQTSAFFWDMTGEKALTGAEQQALITILGSLSEENLTENKHLAGITPEYGFHLVTDGGDYYINQADAPRGQSEMNYAGKQWWIESDTLQEFMLTFHEAGK
jgi:hypothetical protein